MIVISKLLLIATRKFLVVRMLAAGPAFFSVFAVFVSVEIAIRVRPSITIARATAIAAVAQDQYCKSNENSRDTNDTILILE